MGHSQSPQLALSSQIISRPSRLKHTREHVETSDIPFFGSRPKCTRSMSTLVAIVPLGVFSEIEGPSLPPDLLIIGSFSGCMKGRFCKPMTPLTTETVHRQLLI